MLKKIIIILLITIGILVIVAYFLPGKYHVERSVYIKADKSIVFDLARNLEKWDLWTPWNMDLDSTVVFELTGTDGVVGTKRSWNGKKLGDGEIILTRVSPGELVAYELRLKGGKYLSEGKIIIENFGDSCKVSWADDGNLGYNPVSRYMGLFMESMMNPNFDKGLAKLKEIAERRNSWPKMEETMLPEQQVLVILDSASGNDFKKVMRRAYGELFQYLQISGLKQNGPPFSICLKWDSIDKSTVMKIGIPVDKEGKNNGRICAEKVPSQNVIKAYYFGSYDKIETAYNALELYCKESKKMVTGGPWEIYISDPLTETDPMKPETHILFPVE